jgi:effector-binding domain-containing protein
MPEFEIREMPLQPVLAVRRQTSLAELPQIIGETYHQIMTYLATLGELPAYAPYTAYYNMDMANLDVALGFPVSHPLAGQGPIMATEMPAGQYVVHLYKGPYSELGSVYEQLMAWITQQKLEPEGIFYEFYMTGPETPASEMLTEIRIPVRPVEGSAL